MPAVVGVEKPILSLDCRRAGHDAVAIAVDFVDCVDCRVVKKVKKSGRWQGLRGNRRCSVPVSVAADNCYDGCRWIAGSWSLQFEDCWQTVGIGEVVAFVNGNGRKLLSRLVWECWCQ